MTRKPKNSAALRKCFTNRELHKSLLTLIKFTEMEHVFFFMLGVENGVLLSVLHFLLLLYYIFLQLANHSSSSSSSLKLTIH